MYAYRYSLRVLVRALESRQPRNNVRPRLPSLDHVVNGLDDLLLARPDLLRRVALPQRERIVLERLVVDRDACERRIRTISPCLRKGLAYRTVSLARRSAHIACRC